MTRSALAVLGWLILTTAPGGAAKESPETCTRYDDLEIEICTRMRPPATAVGQKSKLIVRVEGAQRPVAVRLVNATPTVLELEKGPVRTARIRTQERFKVESVGPGTGLIWVMPHFPDDPAREAGYVARELAPFFAAEEELFRERREILLAEPEATAPPVYPAAAVEDLLALTERRLVDGLALPELEPLRDLVEHRFARAREELRDVRKAAAGRPAPRAAAAVLRGPPPRAARARAAKGTVPKERADPVLDRLAAFLGGLAEAARENALVTDLCVTSAPAAGATFVMYPPSYPKSRHQTLTRGALRTVYRGLYHYEIKTRGGKIRCRGDDCAPLDLFDDPRTLFHCDFEAGDGGACARREGTLADGCGDG